MAKPIISADSHIAGEGPLQRATAHGAHDAGRAVAEAVVDALDVGAGRLGVTDEERDLVLHDNVAQLYGLARP